MGQNFEAKQAIVDELSRVAGDSIALVAADYSGLTVSDLNKLRVSARHAGVYLKVVKNNLLERAVEGSGFVCIQGHLRGPLIVAFSAREPSAAAQVMRDFTRVNDKLRVQFLVLSGRFLAAESLGVVARLPTKEEAIAKLMGLMKAPISKLVQTLAAPYTKLTRALVAIKESKTG